MILDLAQCSTCQLPLTVLLWLAAIAAAIAAGACCAAIIVLMFKMVFEKY